MKNILLYILPLLFLASCSQGRYGHVPKVKRNDTKQVYKPVTKRKTQPTEIAQKNNESVVFVDTVKRISVESSVKEEIITETKNEIGQIAIIQPKREHKKISKNSPTAATEKNVSKNKVNTTKQTKTAKSTGGIFEDFWSTELGELIIKLGFLIVGFLLIAFVEWLVSIGLGWLVIIIGLALLIWLLIEIAQFFDDLLDGIFDGIFRRRY